MKTLEQMAETINRLNAEKKELYDELGNARVLIDQLERFAFRIKGHVDLDGDLTLFNSFIQHKEPEFETWSNAVRNYKKRWGITGDTF